jgi:hypothetical protein
VAKQLPSGRWASKNNQFDIFEHSVESLESEPGAVASPFQAAPEECRETLPDGEIIVHLPLNFGRLALVMSRSAAVR